MTTRVTPLQILVELRAHAARDDERFAAQTSTLGEIHTNVKSLLDSRSYVRGAWKGIAISAGIVSAIVAAAAKLIDVYAR